MIYVSHWFRKTNKQNKPNGYMTVLYLKGYWTNLGEENF